MSHFQFTSALMKLGLENAEPKDDIEKEYMIYYECIVLAGSLSYERSTHLYA